MKEESSSLLEKVSITCWHSLLILFFESRTNNILNNLFVNFMN